MCKLNKKSGDMRIDPCLKNLIKALESSDHKPLACCCGHGKYPLTIIVRTYGNVFELLSGKAIHRKKRFYRKDKQGYYFIPEVLI